MNAARKSQPGDEKRDDTIRVRVSKTEKEEISKLAKIYGYVSESEFVRRAVLGYQNVDRELLK